MLTIFYYLRVNFNTLVKVVDIIDGIDIYSDSSFTCWSNKNIHVEIINSLKEYFNELGFYIKNLTYSPIKGGDGNVEYLVYLSNKIDKNSNLDILGVVNRGFSNKG